MKLKKRLLVYIVFIIHSKIKSGFYIPLYSNLMYYKNYPFLICWCVKDCSSITIINVIPKWLDRFGNF